MTSGGPVLLVWAVLSALQFQTYSKGIKTVTHDICYTSIILLFEISLNSERHKGRPEKELHGLFLNH